MTFLSKHISTYIYKKVGGGRNSSNNRERFLNEIYYLINYEMSFSCSKNERSIMFIGCVKCNCFREIQWRWALPFTRSLSVFQGVNCILRNILIWEKYLYNIYYLLFRSTGNSNSSARFHYIKYWVGIRNILSWLTISSAGGHNEK